MVKMAPGKSLLATATEGDQVVVISRGTAGKRLRQNLLLRQLAIEVTTDPAFRKRLEALLKRPANRPRKPNKAAIDKFIYDQIEALRQGYRDRGWEPPPYPEVEATFSGIMKEVAIERGRTKDDEPYDPWLGGLSDRSMKEARLRHARALKKT